MIEYYISNVVPILQYGILIYGCCSYSQLEQLNVLQKKILKFIFSENVEIVVMIFLKNIVC